jgi:hypothetical protein
MHTELHAGDIDAMRVLNKRWRRVVALSSPSARIAGRYAMLKRLAATYPTSFVFAAGVAQALPYCEEILKSCRGNTPAPNHVVCETAYRAAVSAGGHWPETIGRREKMCSLQRPPQQQTKK